MQSRVYLSKLGGPFLRQTLVTARAGLFRPLKLRYVPTNSFRCSHSIRTGEVNWAPIDCSPVSQAGEEPEQSVERPRAANNAPITPNDALASYLDILGDSKRGAYWYKIRHQLPWDSLPVILIHYLHVSRIPKDDWVDDDHEIHKVAVKSLEDQDLSFVDVEDWAKIVLEDSTDERVHRFLGTLSYYPSFLLLEICRVDLMRVGTIKAILIHVWERVIPKNHLGTETPSTSSTSAPLSHISVDSNGQPSHQTIPSSDSSGSPRPLHSIEENAFSVLLHRLMHQCRRICPPALVTIAHMFGPYIDTLQIDNLHGLKNPNYFQYRRICHLQNSLLQALALPANIEPLRSMRYNWSAQKVILELAGTFSPPLTLNEPAYQAVMQVLLASKKTPSESRSTSLRTRSWPPWRVEQDGMDAQREPEEDLSRTIAALMRKRESGYSDSLYDRMISILGGQESDGTPTIQTRTILKNRYSAAIDLSPHQLNPNIWATRIEATRDIREAWAAFAEFFRRDGEPNLFLYYVMLRKLTYEAKRLAEYEYEPSPGDGRELLPVPDDNISDFYRSRLEPPSLEELYDDMISRGLRPSGQCLSFLVQHSFSIKQALRYLLDSGLSSRGLECLHGGDLEKQSSLEVRDRVRQEITEVVPSQMIVDFVILLCRFAPRADIMFRFKFDSVETQDPNSSRFNKTWVLRQRKRSRHPIFAQPLQHAAYLLRTARVKKRPAWYALFRGLAHRSTVMLPKFCGEPKNHELAWRVTTRALEEFQRIGLELGPHGFKYICDTFTKYANAYSKMPQFYREKVLEGSEIIKSEFKKLVACNEPSPYHLPRLMHLLHLVQLHAFVRAMASIGNHDEIIFLLEWMVANHDELKIIAESTANGTRLQRRTLIAIRIFCEGTDFEHRAHVLIDSIESLGGWPTDLEVRRYKLRAREEEDDGEFAKDDGPDSLEETEAGSEDTKSREEESKYTNG
ncbi:hypothetical protein EG329_013228 [Mollisiaceae sp. DMI_Dod_QoI]|nr:hypothetical protein EG329_013228 [Helotiales sp. DMI_Dod_QoI]